jgi:AmmeMemoRadiSam system protein A
MERMPFMTIDPAARNELLALARTSIEHGLSEGRQGPAPDVATPVLNDRRATFVTLRARDDLRGCCGSIEPRFALAEDVWRNAWASAFADPRFPPLVAEEYPLLDFHISVLSPLERMSVWNETELLSAMRPGIDGLLLQLGAARATFLPAVWENLADPIQFVRHLKLKAGWNPDFWSPQIEVWRYQTESFGESPE